jgi:hypothetical protein
MKLAYAAALLAAFALPVFADDVPARRCPMRAR